jgi:hypothetical protein
MFIALELFVQAFRLQRRFDRGARLQIGTKALQVRPFAKFDTDMTGPTKNHEQVRIRDGERIAGEKVF